MTKPEAFPMQIKDGNVDAARGFTSGNIFEAMPERFSKDNFAAVL